MRFRTVKLAVDYFPALVFLGIACFIASRLAVNFFPSEYSWHAFFAFTPMGREISLLFPLETPAQKLFWCGGFVLAGLYSISLAGRFAQTRERFFAFHGALIILLYSMSDERIFVATSHLDSHLDYDRILNFSAMTPGFAILLLGVLLACVSVHWKIVWNVRHPMRRPT